MHGTSSILGSIAVSVFTQVILSWQCHEFIHSRFMSVQSLYSDRTENGVCNRPRASVVELSVKQSHRAVQAL